MSSESTKEFISGEEVLVWFLAYLPHLISVIDDIEKRLDKLEGRSSNLSIIENNGEE